MTAHDDDGTAPHADEATTSDAASAAPPASAADAARTADPAGLAPRTDAVDADGAVERLLRRADPARSLPPLDLAQIAHLKETTMSRAADERTPESTTPTPARAGADARRPRRRVGWAVAVGAAAAVLAVVGITAAVQLSASTGAGASHVTELAGGPGNGAEIALKCAEITPEMLAGSADVAFEATATSIADDGTVTLTVTDRYAGDITDVVEVPQGDDVLLDGMPLHYDEGGSYLIAASEGAILTCGQSGPVTPDLEQLYAAAFGR
ncbi:hypothetical protein [Herbiconiux ginsengi]|uniref:Uncharacterized protein n=1 Tax=Herbiconiux ginsengi TaxID=381665 RepID=A0A1H3QNA7_9MICO|nr:hypothetical protein [Herbiconiux ginsengi]SDZ14867.1 hypothetical protein SAMN05216554_2639 [Herbiconiux ginsengi]